MPRPILDDALWKLVEPLLPKMKRRRRVHPGRKPITHRQALTGILFVLRTGIPWAALPLEMGCGLGGELLAAPGGMAASWRLDAGAWDAAHPAAGDRANRVVAYDCGQLFGACHARGKKTGPNPTDRRKAGNKHRLISDARGIPLAATLTPANAHDITQLVPLIIAIPPVAGKRGRPRQRPDSVQGDRAYDSAAHRRTLRALGITPILAKRRTGHGSGLGKTRWVIERSLAWLHQFRRLKMRYERLHFVHEAFLTIACSLICWNFLKPVTNSF